MDFLKEDLDQLEKKINQSLSRRSTVNNLRASRGQRRKQFFKLNSFDIGRVLGEGKFGKVYYAKEKKHFFEVAIKKIQIKSYFNDLKKERQIFFEIYTHSQINHPNIIDFLIQFRDREYIYLVMDYAERGTLCEYQNLFKYRRLPEEVAAKFAFQIADALVHIHSQGFLYGDLKPENVLLDAFENAKLTDFGFSFPLCDSFMIDGQQINGGTTEYMPPELLYGEPFNELVDHWSLGVLIFELMAGYTPFNSKKLATCRDKIAEVKYNFPKHFPKAPRNLISGFLQKDMYARKPIFELFFDPWILKYNSQRPHFLNPDVPWPYDLEKVKLTHARVQSDPENTEHSKFDKETLKRLVDFYEQEESWYVPCKKLTDSLPQHKDEIEDLIKAKKMKNENDKSRDKSELNLISPDVYSEDSTDFTTDEEETTINIDKYEKQREQEENENMNQLFEMLKNNFSTDEGN